MQLSVFVTPKDFKTSFRFTVGGDGPYEILPAPIVSERQGWRGGKGPDCHTGMIYSREGMRHQCWSLVIVSTERGRQVGDEYSTMVFPGVGSHQCTGEVMVRAYSHVLQP